jgi:hypothetical protein
MKGGIDHPEWWGIDGTADEVQINAAITALPRGAVQLLAGQYVLAAAVSCKQNVAIIGVDNSRGYGYESTSGPSDTAYKTQLYQETVAANGVEVNGTTSLLTGFRISNLDIKGNNGTGKGLYIVGDDPGTNHLVMGGLVENVTIWNFDGTGGVGFYAEGTFFRIGFFSCTAHHNKYNWYSTDDTYSGSPSQIAFYNCSFRGENSEALQAQQYNFYNDSGGVSWGFYNCEFSKAQHASGGIGFYTDGIGIAVGCNFEHCDIGAQAAAQGFQFISCSFNDCDTTGLKISAANCAIRRCSFGLGMTGDDITIDAGAERTILCADVASDSLSITDNTTTTICEGRLIINSDGSIGGSANPIFRTYTTRLRGEVQTVNSYSNSVAIDLEDGMIVKHILTENTTFANPTNMLEGDELTIMVRQDAGNSYTYNVSTAGVGNFRINSTGMPRTVTAGKHDVIKLKYIGSNWWGKVDEDL